MIRLRQHVSAPKLDDVKVDLTNQLKIIQSQIALKSGATVAVACSSRGITGYDRIVAQTVVALKEMGLHPFIVPAMGSHGGANGHGQVRLLSHLGITEASMGVPIRSSMEVVEISQTQDGLPVYIDKNAFQADYIVPINRIKKHTEFENKDFESGLLKMLAIGLGKQKGAATYHGAMIDYGYARVLLSVAREVLRCTPLLFGIGIVENAYRETARIEAILPEQFEAREKALLKEAKALDIGLPFDQADILIIDEIGKEISGTGFDTKVAGRIGLPLLSAEPATPQIKRIVICNMTDASEGNAIGVGVADFVTRRLVDKIDFKAFYVNSLTGVTPEMGKIPVTLENDRECIMAAGKCVGRILPEKQKVIRIKSTLYLKDIEVSEAYLENICDRNDLEILQNVKPMQFDPDGNLLPIEIN